MTVLVLDNPDMLARAALMAGSVTGTLPGEIQRPHRLRFHYGFNKHTPDLADRDILRQHAAYLKSHPGVQVRIHGHADNFGSEEYNRFLARLRAHAVARLLLAEGVHPSAILMAIWGSERPLARPEDRAANRRVELEYLTLDMAQAL